MEQMNEAAGGQEQQHGNGGHDHAHPPYLQHHFDTPVQQFDSTKLGMWLFLGTEILLFSGFFCAYAVYRANHPEIFVYAHQFLDRNLGALNTAVLIFSSLTMAWAVRAAQLSNQKLLVILLSITLLCGFIFLGVKYVEYKQKWEHGLLWGASYKPHHAGHGEDHGAHGVASATAEHAAAGTHAATESAGHPADATGAHAPVEPIEHAATTVSASTEAGTSPEAVSDATGTAVASATAAHSAASVPGATKNPLDEKSTVTLAPRGPAGLAPTDAALDDEGHAIEPKNVQIFFSIYFMMTGLHGIHVIAGMIIIGWILLRSIRGEFNSQYFTPVDLTGLYWHLVDLIWIYLFPLLYLIH